jgi:Na+-transporting NADH:ubiquinone oxidoreductase subunit A
MQTLTIKKGLDLPIKGAPVQEIDPTEKAVTRVAVLGDCFPGLKPTMEVQVGDIVKLGQLLFTDKKMPGVKFTAPGSGKVIEINRGAKRRFLSLVIALEGDDALTFKSYSEDALAAATSEEIQSNLIDSGLWTALRSRPMNKVAAPEEQPAAIFINGMDTNPLAPSVATIIAENPNAFQFGLQVLARLREAKLFLTEQPNSKLPEANVEGLTRVSVEGPHPAGLPGTHMHFLSPVSRNRRAWHIMAQDVVAIGELFSTGQLNPGRIVAIGGPSVPNPRLIKTRMGACVSELMAAETTEGDIRLIAGSVLSGTHATGPLNYLGRYHQQISVLAESRKRRFLGWLLPPNKIHTVKNLTPYKFNNDYDFTTDANGAERPIVPIGSYENVMPLDIVPTYLLRALAVDDVEEAEGLGCFELAEEDLALCAYVCPSKIDHGANLRRVFDIIEKEG